MDAEEAQTALIEHLKAVAPWNVQLEFEREAEGEAFSGPTEGPAFEALAAAMEEAYGRDVTLLGQGGSIPLCTVFKQTFPDAEIMLLGVEEPQCLIHAPNESVDPGEIEKMALVEALFLHKYAQAKVVVARAMAETPTPFTTEDFARRMERATEQAAAAGLTGILVAPGPDLVYFTGYQPIAITERITMLALQASRGPSMIVPILERPDAEAAPGAAALSLADWKDGSDPYAATAGCSTHTAGTRSPTRPGRCTCLPCSKCCQSRRMCR